MSNNKLDLKSTDWSFTDAPIRLMLELEYSPSVNDGLLLH
jgi:hypothetical protein